MAEDCRISVTRGDVRKPVGTLLVGGLGVRETGRLVGEQDGGVGEGCARGVGDHAGH